MEKMNLILGTMTFGQQTMDQDAEEMVKIALENGVKELDTAYVYNEGESERILGRILENTDSSSYKIATKVNPRVTGKLDRAAILAQFEESLKRLQTENVDVLYLHFPDSIVSLEEILETCNELHKQGKFKELGVSNYPASMVAETCELAKEKGWIAPTVYEGVYNVLSRNAEGELFETIRKYGIRYTAYNPLAGGLLSGKYTSVEDAPKDGRFVARAGYKQRYWKESFFKAADILRKACCEAEIPMAEASLRWLSYHSQMDALMGDGIIIGASKISQLIQNIEAVKKGPLPEKTAKIFDSAWEACREDAPPYYRFLKQE